MRRRLLFNSGSGRYSALRIKKVVQNSVFKIINYK